MFYVLIRILKGDFEMKIKTITITLDLPDEDVSVYGNKVSPEEIIRTWFKGAISEDPDAVMNILEELGQEIAQNEWLDSLVA